MRPASQPISRRRKWLAVSAATLVGTVSYWAFLIGFASPAGEASRLSAGSLALGVGLLPFAFLVLAFGSGHPRAPGAVLAAMGLALLVGPPLVVFANPVLGMVAAQAAGAVVALRREEAHSLRIRAVGAAAGVVLVGVLILLAPPVAIAFAPGFAFTSPGLADVWAEAR